MKGTVHAVLLTALLLGGCASQLSLGATPARSTVTSPVRAVLASGAAGTVVTLDNPGLLPEAVRAAADLKAEVGGKLVTVTRNPGGSYVFVLPAGTATTTDVSGNLRVIFVMNNTDSQLVTLGTGSPVQFATPPVTPDHSFIVQGLDVVLTANSSADPTTYQFTWSFGTSASGPFSTIPGQGKSVKWTPPAPGNYFIKVDAVDRSSQQAYSTITSSPVVFVTDTKNVLTTDPASGTVPRGSTVSLKFNKPEGLAGTNLSYAWSYSLSPQAPWSVITGNADAITWLPTGTGSYFIKLEVSNKDTGTVNTFISPNALVFVTEGTPIISPSSPSVERGDRVTLNLNIASAGTGPFQWFYSTGGASAPFTAINGSNKNGKSITQLVDAAGSYTYRVDFPDANGNIQSFVTTSPVLNVHEGALPLITSDPLNAAISTGGSVVLHLNARGVDDTGGYRYTWFYSTNPQAGYTAMPVTGSNDATKKTFTWNTLTFNGGFNSLVPAGSYYIRVDAAEVGGTGVTTFTSGSPVVTIQSNRSN